MSAPPRATAARAGRIVALLVCLLVCWKPAGAAAAKVDGSAPKVGLYTDTMDAPALARIQALLGEAGVPAQPVTFVDDWTAYNLLVMTTPPVAQPARGTRINFAQKLGTYYLRGGRVLLVGAPG